MAQADRLKAILDELDARGVADIEYRAAFSTGSKSPLRRGESWRGRLCAWIERIEVRAGAARRG